MIVYGVLACNCLAAVLLVLGAVKYGTGPVPVTYHRLLLEQEGATLTGGQKLILRGLYRSLAGAMLSLAVVIVALSLGPIRAGAVWAEVLVLVAGLAFTAGAVITPYRIEQATGIQTPWRLSLLIGGLLGAGFILAQLA